MNLFCEDRSVAFQILKLGQVLVATVPEGILDEDLLKLCDALVQRVVQVRCSGVIFDVTALDVMDSFACRTMNENAQVIRLSGAKTVVVGIQPDVAFAMVQMGLKLEGVASALDLEEGLAHLDHTINWRRKDKFSEQ